MGARLLPTVRQQTSDDPIVYRIDPEIANLYIGLDDSNVELRQAKFWDSVGPEYADLARNIAHKVALLRRTSGDSAAEAYREAATSVLESFRQDDELLRKLTS